MRKTLLTLGCAVGAMAFAVPASAATPINFEIDGTTGTLRAVAISCDAGPAGCAGNFTAMGSFMRPAIFGSTPGEVALTLSTSTLFNGSNIDFVSGTLNGTPLTFNRLSGGQFEFGFVGPIAMMDVNTLNISGFTSGNGSFAGDISFSAVPEPSTWAMMLIGFGAIGWMVRRRRSTKIGANVSFA